LLNNVLNTCQKHDIPNKHKYMTFLLSYNRFGTGSPRHVEEAGVASYAGWNIALSGVRRDL
ncbi:MAG: hypothetical protein WBG01_13925, partial [Bacteroidota bacterium]